MELTLQGTWESKLTAELHKLQFAKHLLPEIHVFRPFNYTSGVTGQIQHAQQAIRYETHIPCLPSF